MSKKTDISSISNIQKLPFSIRILLENVLRNHDGFSITDEHVEILKHWNPQGIDKEIPYKPARILLQDFTGVPAIVDLASIRAEAIRKGKSGEKINPQIPVDLVVDHSVQVDYFGTDDAYDKNVKKEYERNSERYELLKWGQKHFENFRVVPPGMGICHQVNLEYLAEGVIDRDGEVFPDTLVGTDSHTPMVNGIGVLGWGVGGIEAEAAMLDQPIFFTCPEVIGLEIKGKLQAGVTATDMVLTITQVLRQKGVVGKFVEVFGDGLDNLSVPDRATISNMSPEFGCTVTYFPIDDQTIDYLKRTGRKDEVVKRVESYAKENMLWRTGTEKIEYSNVVTVDLSMVEPTLSGPKRPQDKILLKDLKNKFKELIENDYQESNLTQYNVDNLRSASVKEKNYSLKDGDIVIAAITSCTNTSNPDVMIGAGLVAKKARALGLNVKPWVKTSLAPGSRVVTNYLEKSELLDDLRAMNFHPVGFGCTSCIGNSGPLPPEIDEAVTSNDLNVSSVLSGNRNFEARVHPKVKMNFLASPMLVVVYAIAGKVDIDLNNEPIGTDQSGKDVFMKDIWPSIDEIRSILAKVLTKDDFERIYKVIFDGEETWKNLNASDENNYNWKDESTYIKEAPFFKDISNSPSSPTNIKNARVLLKLGDSVTTDHISPAGSFSKSSEAGSYLIANGVKAYEFNSYGSRRGNHEVMMRGTFANVRISNELSSKRGGYTTYFPSGEEVSIYQASMKYQKSNTPLIVLGGKEYGSGSSRDWAAKGTSLLGIKAVIAQSYERIHRSNLVGMGVLPLEFINTDADTLSLNGKEDYTITGIESGLSPNQEFNVIASKDNGDKVEFKVRSRLDSNIEIDYYTHGGILHYFLRNFLKKN